MSSLIETKITCSSNHEDIFHSKTIEKEKLVNNNARKGKEKSQKPLKKKYNIFKFNIEKKLLIF